jgi:hypothetical protein
MLRVDLINNSSTDVTVTVKTADSIVYREMLTNTAADLPDGPGQTFPAGSNGLVVPAGRFFGFASSSQVSISNPAPQLVTVIAASDKDPWPQPPPPPPPSMVNVADFSMRYKFFNTVAGVPPKSYRPVPFALAPLPKP